MGECLVYDSSRHVYSGGSCGQGGHSLIYRCSSGDCNWPHVRCLII